MLRVDNANLCILRAMLKKFGIAALMEALTELAKSDVKLVH